MRRRETGGLGWYDMIWDGLRREEVLMRRYLPFVCMFDFFFFFLLYQEEYIAIHFSTINIQFIEFNTINTSHTFLHNRFDIIHQEQYHQQELQLQLYHLKPPIHHSNINHKVYKTTVIINYSSWLLLLELLLLVVSFHFIVLM